MPPRSFWKGYLKLSLVTCPVAMTPAVTVAEKVRFHTLNRATGNRVRSRYVDAETEEPVELEDQVKGYQVGPDEYVMVEDEEFEAVALDTTHTLDIETFVPRESIERIWLDKAHYLVPDDPVGEEAFAVIRDAMAATGTVGISKLVLYRRERAVLLQPRDRGLIVWTLRYGDEVRDPKDYFGQIKETKPPADLAKLAQSVIAERTRDWDESLVGDRVQANLMKTIRAKQKGRRPPQPKAEAPPPETGPETGKVVSIMDALKRSLASERKPARGKGR